MSQRVLLSANEAVAWAACKAGCAVASAYPGTPSTEILENVAKFKASIYCEWAVNEKVGMEVAIGASISGARALTAMKHVGLNVAMDPLMTYTYVGANGGLVIITADDPGMHSSQNEQDNRTLVRFARAVLFEPADSQEAFDMVIEAFEVSERYQVPVFVRLTTRTSHTSTVVDVGDDFAPGHPPRKPYVKDIRRYIPVPMFARPQRLKAQERTAVLRDLACASPFNRIEAGDTRFGIITSGVTYQYVKEVFPEFAVLKLGFSNPFPAERVREFAASVERVLVIEELDPFIEEQVRALGIPVVGHTTELNMFEMNPLRLMTLRNELLGDITLPEVRRADAGLPTRPPVLCAGCSHRGVFYTLAKLGATVTGDIGCYTLGAFPPLNAMDTTICMGASVGNAYGMEKAGKGGRLCAVIGDSTFFHSGMTGILNVLYNGGRTTTVVLDNRITGMTGHQDNPGSGKTLCGDPAPVTDIAEVAKAMGFRRVVKVDAYDLKTLEKVLAEELDADEPSVVVAGGPCRIAAKLMNAGTFEVDAEKCKACGACFKLGCPAIERGETVVEGKRYKAHIDPVQCSGCDLCPQVCKFDAIKRVR
ncbi:MAG TPA: indolepyruvate ferredoxin oxidoreductase subunit alpha [Kiritimatiellia bacterium]|nr:indolepyruvate ferredoxin oxidoreductase subunit alpha [Kiritimatiellia bacterium]